MHSLKCSRFELESLEAFDRQSLNRRRGTKGESEQLIRLSAL